jgi:hypothetical protein
LRGTPGCGESFSLSDRELLGYDTVPHSDLDRRVGNAEKGSGVAHGEPFIENVFLDFCGELQEAEQVGDSGSVLTHPLGDVVLGELEFVLEAAIGHGFFNAVEIPPLDVFNEGHFQRFAGGSFPQHDGDFRKACEPCRVPPPLPGEDPVVVRQFPSGHQDGLQHPFFTDRLDQFFQLVVLNLLAGLIGIGLQSVHRAVQELDVLPLKPVTGRKKLVQAATEATLILWHVTEPPG